MPDNRHPKQVSLSRVKVKNLLALLLLMFLLAPLTACGKKPNQVDPPPGVEDSAFPKTYPDPATDPKPE
jgi:hypothetical protein